VIKINNREIGGDNPAYIIAEMGINYNGSLELAMEMVEEAARCRVDAVKVQIISAGESYTRKSESYSVFKKVELKFEEWRMLVNRARELGIDIFSTFVNTFDLEYAKELDLPAIKISSTNLTNFPLLEAVAKLEKPVLISTGMCYLSEVDEAIRFLEEKGQGQIGILQCTSLYPTYSKDVNLLAIQTLARAFSKYPIGFSDHTIGINCAVASVAIGGKIVEKHFTLDRNMEGPDHHFSSTLEELALLVKSVREVESALGTTAKQPVPEEILLRERSHRNLVAAQDIKEGDILSYEKICVKRSEIKGISPKDLKVIIGRTARENIVKDETVTWDAI
jgi:sialic acid synthase SpsE